MTTQFPIDNENVNTGDSVFENVFIYGKLNYDFSSPPDEGEDSIPINFDKIAVRKWIAVGTTATFSSDVTIAGDLSLTNLIASGSITANSYENFEFADLPIGTAEEPTFGPNKVLMVKGDSTGYELVDPSQLNPVQLRSTGVIGDGTIYSGTGAITDSKLVISGISTVNFQIEDKVKVFGATPTTDSTTISAPASNANSSTPIPAVGGAATRTYYYWIAEYNLTSGIVGPATQALPAAGIRGTTLDDMNASSHSSLTLSRSSVNNGLLVYRQEYVGSGNAGNADITQAKLIGILGRKELGDSTTSSINWKDYGNYDQTAWAGKGISNEFVGSGTTTHQIHFPVVASTSSFKGWNIDEVVSIDSSSITLNSNYNLNSGNAVKVVHDNTYALKQAIDTTVANGGNTLTLSGGTFLVNKLTIPTNFTISGNGKNTVIKKQYFGNDPNDGGGNSLTFDGKLIGIGITNGKDITIQNLTIDGNNVNNINFSADSQNYLIFLEGISSSLIKDIEIRNSPASGLYLNTSKRVSVENCTFVDGSLSDRYYYRPLSAQGSEVLRLNGCLIENYPGSVDVSSSTVVAATGNIIRNCGTGLESYATGKITTINNIMLGPADEWLPSPDIYDSDWDGVNVTITRGSTFEGPVLQFLEDGEPKDLRAVHLDRLIGGIGTMVGLGGTNATDVSLGSTFMPLNLLTPETGAYGKQNGYIQVGLTDVQTNTIGIGSVLGYEIVASEYQSVPTGLSTYVGIDTAVWGGGGGTQIGSGCTNYLITLTDSNDFNSFAEGDLIKLVGHEVSPDLSSQEMVVGKKVDGVLKKLEMRFNPNPGTTAVNSTGGANGEETGYIYKRKVFTIAKGRVGVN